MIQIKVFENLLGIKTYVLYIQCTHRLLTVDCMYISLYGFELYRMHPKHKDF